jgi:cysteinyl-tRNA synthetase
MPRAAATLLFGLIKAAENECKRVSKDSSSSLDLADLQYAVSEVMKQMDKGFGIFYQVPMTNKEEQAEEEGHKKLFQRKYFNYVVFQRTEAKESNDWELADSLRAQITELGFIVSRVE